MRRRPKSFDIFAIFLAGIFVGFPIQIMLLYDHGPSEYIMVLQKLTTMNCLVMAALAGNIYLALKASPFLKVSLPLLAVLVSINNLIVGYAASDYSMNVALGATVGFLSGHLAFYRSHIISILHHPERRWWLTPIRKNVQISATVNPFNGTSHKAQTFDISEGGVFIMLHQGNKLQVNDRIKLSLALGSLTKFRCDGRVVRTSPAQGNHPGGIGVAFESLSRNDRRVLRKYVERTTNA